MCACVYVCVCVCVCVCACVCMGVCMRTHGCVNINQEPNELDVKYHKL